MTENDLIEDITTAPELETEPPRKWYYFFRENIWVFFILVVFAINGVLIYQNFFRPTPPVPEMATIIEEPIGPPEGMVASQLTGAYIPEEVGNLRPLAVMIDNFPTARPSSGLSRASIIWETMVEGGVTRFMAVFQTNESVTIGPVRSAREYFLPWVKEVDAMYVHSGGSPKALELLAKDKDIIDANEFVYGQAYYRRSGLSAPHNLYTKTERQYLLANNKGWNDAPEIKPWLTSEEKPAKSKTATIVAVSPSLAPYRVRWRWDEEKAQYLRSSGGVVDIDRENKKELGAENVVVQFTNVVPAPRQGVPDAFDVSVVGTGEAMFLRNGVLVSGIWRKLDASSRTEFIDEAGNEYVFTPGRVWIQVVPKNTEIIIIE